MISKILSEIGTVFMLHRIAPYQKGNIIYNENMKISPDELEDIIRELKHQNRVFISMDELTEILKNRKKLKNKFIVFTLDDGYRDNLEYAYPIFKKFSIPFCIYVTNSFPNRTTNLWWYALEKLIFKNETLILPGKGRIENLTIESKNKNFLELRENILNNHFFHPIEYLEQIGKLEFNIEEEMNEKCLNWEEIKFLSNDSLVTIGCHTLNHYPLSKLSDREVRCEISNSKTELELKIGKAVKHFAFPFGGKVEADKREYKIAGSCEFDTVATAMRGHVYRQANLLQLDRLFLFPLQTNSFTLKKLMNKNLKDHYKHLLKKIR